jgi:hypothetical protein
MSVLMRDRARRGAAWLDTNMPGWHRRIDTARLDIEFTNCCIMGQLTGDYNDWQETVPPAFPMKHGLFIRHQKDKNWRKQTDAWREEVTARQRAEVFANN